MAKPRLMMTDIALNKKSVQLQQDPKSQTTFSLTFTFDSVGDCLITFYYLVKEVKDSVTELTVKYTNIKRRSSELSFSFSALSEIVPPPKTYKFPPGRNRKFPEHVASIDLSLYGKDVLFSKDSSTYGLVVRMEKVDQSKEKGHRIFYNYFQFVEGATPSPSKRKIDYPSTLIKMVRQKMELDQQSFEIMEIFGINSSVADAQQATIEDTEKECVICMSEKIDTIILPCRHFCLCVACAKSLSELKSNTSEKKCPVCRNSKNGAFLCLKVFVDIESFLRLTKAMSAQQNIKGNG